MIAFIIAIVLMLITPGPGVLSTAAVGASFGLRAGYRYVAGLCVGNFSVALIVVSGLWALLEAIPYLRITLGLLSVAYFGYLAFKIAVANNEIGFGKIAKAPRFVDGILLQLINPKAYAVSAFLFSNFPFFPDNWPLEAVIKLLVFTFVWIPLHIAWLYMGYSVQKLELSARVQRRVNLVMALSLVAVVVLALFSF